MSEANGEIPEFVEVAHPFFKPFGNPHFRMSEPTNGRPVFVATLGDSQVALPVRGILREHRIAENSRDGITLLAVERALQYVTVLRMGDPFPTELRTGAASWIPSREHRELARQRVTMQLVSWIAGKETLITDPLELQQLFDHPATREKINTAFEEAAGALDIEGGTKDDVAQRVEALAEELAYIESLRDRYHAIVLLKEKLDVFRKVFQRQMSMLMEIDPVRRLIAIPLKELAATFELVDAQTGEILSVLRNLDAQRDYIRKQRNELHCRLMAWNEVLSTWQAIDPYALETFGLTGHIRELYRFLAPRFMPVDEWVLMTAPVEPQNRKPSSAMTW